MFFCEKQINKYFNIMIKKKLIKFLVLLFFVSGCGYTPIYTSKNSKFAITQLSTTGNNKLNRIISEKLANYKDASASNQLTLTIKTLLNKEVSSKDSRGNPKTYRINLKSNIVDIIVKLDSNKENFMEFKITENVKNPYIQILSNDNSINYNFFFNDIEKIFEGEVDNILKNLMGND